MDFLKRYLLPRLIQYLVVIVIGITFVFLIPRLSPVDPVQQLINTIRMQGTYLDPQAAEKLTETLKELYGLKGSLLQQYLAFWKRLVRGDFGPSLFQFPIPVVSLIKSSLPWTTGLLTVSTIISDFEAGSASQPFLHIYTGFSA
jgi:peptide/nickel transport system permease protein